MAKPVKGRAESARDSFRNPEAFLDRLEKIAGHFSWHLLEDRFIRARVDGVECCPLAVYGWHRSGPDEATRTIPDSRNISGHCGIHDSVASCVVHHADAVITSRYYRTAYRERLLRICGLREPSSEPIDEVVDEPAVV